MHIGCVLDANLAFMTDHLWIIGDPLDPLLNDAIRALEAAYFEFH